MLRLGLNCRHAEQLKSCGMCQPRTRDPYRSARRTQSTVLGQRDQQRQGGCGKQHHLDPPAHWQVVPVEKQDGEAPDGEEQYEEDDQPAPVTR